jgi:hypothetical protein
MYVVKNCSQSNTPIEKSHFRLFVALSNTFIFYSSALTLPKAYQVNLLPYFLFTHANHADSHCRDRVRNCLIWFIQLEREKEQKEKRILMLTGD